MHTKEPFCAYKFVHTNLCIQICAYKNEEDAKYDAHEQFGLCISICISKSKENWQSTRLEIKRKQVQEISSEYCLVDNKRVIIYQ